MSARPAQQEDAVQPRGQEGLVALGHSRSNALASPAVVPCVMAVPQGSVELGHRRGFGRDARGRVQRNQRGQAHLADHALRMATGNTHTHTTHTHTHTRGCHKLTWRTIYSGCIGATHTRDEGEQHTRDAVEQHTLGMQCYPRSGC
jgi:hypothetical protein